MLRSIGPGGSQFPGARSPNKNRDHPLVVAKDPLDAGRRNFDEVDSILDEARYLSEMIRSSTPQGQRGTG